MELPGSTAPPDDTVLSDEPPAGQPPLPIASMLDVLASAILNSPLEKQSWYLGETNDDEMRAPIN